MNRSKHKYLRIAIKFCFLFFLIEQVEGQEGYYKDLFFDGGVCLSNKVDFAAAKALKLSMEFIATEDKEIQNGFIIGNEYDLNGALLYPDNQPRYRLIYTPGGYPTGHGYSLGDQGRKRIRTFYNNGGSYCGSCAGAYLVTIHDPRYYHLWPGFPLMTGMEQKYLDHILPKDSPLYQYSIFDSDSLIKNVFHNNGCYINELPDSTESLLLYKHQNSNHYLHKKTAAWAYKKSRRSGRLVVTGSHPEIDKRGAQLALMQALLEYALDGQGDIRLKGDLDNGVPRIMDKNTEDNDPELTKIGDKQYHHFKIEIPKGAQNFRLKLKGDERADLNLYLSINEFAFASTANYASIGLGASKQINLPSILEGMWYVGVECATTVKGQPVEWGTRYFSNLFVLNGIGYSLTASWDEPSKITDKDKPNISEPVLLDNYPNPFNNSTTISYQIPNTAFVELIIYNLLGQEVKTLVFEKQEAGRHTIEWNACGYVSGIYIYQMRSRINGQRIVLTKRLTHIK